MNNTIYVTTSIPYVNARPHVGFALELVQADAIARYHRLCGRNVRFQTGADENAFKNVLSAQQAGVPVREFVDGNTAAFRALVAELNASPDCFIRTTDAAHARGVHRLWRELDSRDVYLRNYRGLYCTGCEDFLLERDLADGKCPEHDRPPVGVEERNYFFRLSRYQQAIESLIADGRLRVTPGERRNEVLAFVRRGLTDISISRLAERAAGWGIRVPGDDSQVVYVWIDALINYISGAGFGTSDAWREVWSPDARKIHVIGKNVWKFHAIYWPALLLSAGLPLPDELVVHGFLTENGRKIGKSLGNAVDPCRYIAGYGADAVRYYLLRAIPPFGDGDFSAARLAELYETDLANGVGNLLRRVTSLAQRASFGRFDAPRAPEAPPGFREAIERHEFDAALARLWEGITLVNQEIDRVKPWEALRRGDRASVCGSLAPWLAELHRIGHWLQPFLPGAGRLILDALARDPIAAAEPPFPRIEHATSQT